jgi:hypothetical protein
LSEKISLQGWDEKMDKGMNSHSECLAADRVEVREVNERVVIEVTM